MNDRTEKLCWEVLRVLAKYHPHEVDDAIKLMKGSKLLDKPTRLIAEAASVRNKSRTPSPNQELPLDQNSKMLNEIFNELDEKNKSILRELAEGIVSKKYLSDNRVIREYGSRLNLRFDKKIPTRPAVALKVIEELLKISPHIRSEFIEAARNIKSDTSSLQRWSDLIVK